MRTLNEVLAAHPPPFVNLDGTPATFDGMQMADIVQLATWGRALGDLPVGYGKTGIATYVALMRENALNIILVPPILIVQWVKWLNSVPGAGRAIAYTGGPKHRLGLPIEEVDWLVMSYQVFNNDQERLRRACADANVMLIVDEAQSVKGRGVLFKNVRDFSLGRDLLLMSGTIMSSPGDGYAYVKLNSPQVYRSYSQFENIHVAKRDFFNKPTEWANLDVLQQNLDLRRVQRTKEEVHSTLPKARFIPILYDLDPEHMKLYRRLMEEQLLVLDDGSKIDATTAQNLYHAAQQIVTNYGFFAGDESKRSAVFDLIDEVAGEIELGQPGRSKLILWTLYRRTSRAVWDHMQAYLDAQAKSGLHLPNLRSVAAFSEVDAKKSVAAFLDDPSTVSLTAQPGSAGAGLNPQHLCWECGFVETPTRTIAFVQSSGRIDRKGQRYNPNIRLFIARGTIQERLLANLLENDKLVTQASGTKKGIRDLIFP